MKKKNLQIKASSLSEKAHWLLNKSEINKSQLVNKVLEREADRHGYNEEADRLADVD